MKFEKTGRQINRQAAWALFDHKMQRHQRAVRQNQEVAGRIGFDRSHFADVGFVKVKVAEVE